MDFVVLLRVYGIHDRVGRVRCFRDSMAVVHGSDVDPTRLLDNPPLTFPHNTIIVDLSLKERLYDPIHII